MSKIGQKGVVLSGLALLLVLPALLLSATFLTVVETGGEITATQSLSDQIAFKADDIKQTLRSRKEHGDRLDKKALQEIEESFEESPILGDIEINYTPFDIRVEYSGDYNYISYPVVHATDDACRISNLKEGDWSYNFEAFITKPDYDFNEPLLRLERLENGNWKVTVAPTFTHSNAYCDNVKWGDKTIFKDVNREGEGWGSGTGGAGDGLHENESKIVSGVPTSVLIELVLEDPGGTVHYEETFSLRKPEE